MQIIITQNGVINDYWRNSGSFAALFDHDAGISVCWSNASRVTFKLLTKQNFFVNEKLPYESLGQIKQKADRHVGELAPSICHSKDACFAELDQFHYLEAINKLKQS